MDYDFKTLANRKNIGSRKWDLMAESGGKITEKTVPLTIADMDFLMARPIVNGLKSFIEENVLGYFWPKDSYYESIINWMDRRKNYKIKKEWIIPNPSVKAGFTASIRALTKKGEGVIINQPTYGPMIHSIEDSDLKLVNVPLINKNMHYEFDFKGFEKACKDPNNKVFLFCSPHNPTGRVWKKSELSKIGEICLANDITIVSDEIWSDFIMPDYVHIPIASLSKEIEEITITCTSASKSFNIAGLSVANLIVSNEMLRKKVIKELQYMRTDSVNGLGLIATEIAYNECETWFDELIKVLEKNRKIGEEFFEKNNLPVSKAEGTYLLWVDFSSLDMEDEEINDFLEKQAGFYSTRGLFFGKEGKCYRRVNIALPSRDFKVQLDMLEKALEARRL